MPVYRVAVADRKTGHESAMQIEADTEAAATARAMEQGKAVSGVALVKTAAAVAHEKVDAEDQKLRAAIASAVTVAIWRLVAALMLFAFAISILHAVEPKGGFFVGLFLCMVIALVIAFTRRP